MPNAGDPFLSGGLPLSHNPLQRISFDPFALIPDLADVLQVLVTWVEDFLFPAIKQLTGVDLSPFLAEVQSVISNLETLFGSLNPSSGTFDPNAAVQAFINLCVDLGVSFPLALIQDMGGFTSGIPVLSQLIGALTGGNLDGSGGLGSLASFFNFGAGSTSIIGVIESMISSIPGVGPLIDTFLTFLTGTSSSGGTLGDLSSALNNIPLIGPLLNLLTGSATTGGGGLGALGSVFTDLFGLLGNPTGLGTGSAGIPAVGSIPLFGPLINEFISMLGGSGSGLGGLTSVFGDLLGLLGSPTGLGSGSPTLGSNIPILGPLIDVLVGGLGGSGSGNPLSTLTGLMDNIPLIGPLIESLTGGNLTGSSATLGNLASFFNFSPGTSNILSIVAAGVMDFASLVSAFVPGMSGGTQTDFNSIIGNMLSMLGNPLGLLGGSFDPISAGSSMLQNVLTPAGALSSFTQLPAHLFGIFAPNNLTNELQGADSGFDDPSHFADRSFWDGTIGRTVNSSIVGSLKFTANGAYQQFVGVPLGADASQTINVGIYAHWQSLVTTAGNQIVLAVEAYDTNDNLIPNPTGRVVMAISNAGANSSTYTGAPTMQPPVPAQGTAGWDGGTVPGWVYLSGPYKPPAGTSYIRLSPEITTATQAGQVNLDDSYMLHDQGLFDASILTNFTNMLDGSIPGTKIGGLQGIEDMITTWTQHVDGLFNAVNDGPTQTNVPFFQLFNLMQLMSLNAGNAQSLAANNTNILGFKLGKAGILGGTQPSGEANFTHATMPDSTTMPTTSLATGQAIGGWIRVGQSASKGFVDFVAAKAASGTTGIFMNLYKQDTSTGTKTRVYASPDIAAVIPTAVTAGISQMLIPGGLNVVPGDVLWGELVNNSGSALIVGKRSSPFPDHFNTYPRNIGHTRTVATLGTSPATLTPTDTVTSQTAPVLNFGIASVPADYHLPQMDTLPPSPSSGAGNYPYTIPSFITTGDLIDLIVVGGGGSGMSEWNAGVMAGGLGGTPNGKQFVYGSDIHGTGLTVIPAGTTQLQCAVGAGGPHPGGYWANGNPGTDSVWTCLDGPSAGTELLRGTAGAGGSGSVGLSSGTGSGPTPNPFVFDGKSYAMGPNVGINATGAIPGGGGGGATWYELGGSGARGQGWAYAQKYVSP